MQKMDIVIAWVDGSDPAWARRRAPYAGESETAAAADATRFASNQEIYFCIASILQYVPFCGTIFVVTDGQVPAHLHEFHEQGLCDPEKIKIIDHKEIFEGCEEFYPTFNSLSIESLLWKIKGLSRYFLYLNDDFFFNAPASTEDFIRTEKVVLRGHWANSLPIKIKTGARRAIANIFAKKPAAKHTVSQMLSAEAVGLKKFFKVHHHPHIMDKDVLARFFQQRPEVLQRQIQHRFRSIDQLNPVALAGHLKIKNNEALLQPDVPVAYLKNLQGVQDFLMKIKNEKIKYGCMQSLDQLPTPQVQQINFAMREKFKQFLPQSMCLDGKSS